MPQSLSQVILHIVFSTQDRRPWLKKTSSAWIKSQGKQYRTFFWQGGYGDFSIGLSQLDGLMLYIDRQEQRHRTQSFEDEHRNLVRKYRVEFDERYVWA
jgi:hypothetical protein